MSDSYVCSGATMKCSCGTSQARLTVLPTRTVFLTGKPMANISDHTSFVNLGAFGRCRSLGFPATASATAAAHGHLTPMPCVHNTPFPWMGGKNDYLIKGEPALLKSSKCQCMWGGTISLVTDGQTDTGPADISKKSRERITLRKAKEKVIDELIEDMEKGNPTILDYFLDGAKDVYDGAKEAVYNGAKDVYNGAKEVYNEGKELINKEIDQLADVIYKYGGDEVVEVMDDIAKGKYFGTEQWKYLLDQSYNLMEDGYVEGNNLKKNAGSVLYLICSAWQEDTWIDTFETVHAADGIIETMRNPNKLTEYIGKTKGKIKLVDMRTKTGHVLKQIFNTYKYASDGKTILEKTNDIRESGK